jgi:hypothetical protein
MPGSDAFEGRSREALIAEVRRRAARRRLIRRRTIAVAALAVCAPVLVPLAFGDGPGTQSVSVIAPPTGPTSEGSPMTIQPTTTVQPTTTTVPTKTLSPTTSTPTTEPSSAPAKNLVATAEVKAQLLAAFAQAKGYPQSTFQGPLTGSVYYGYLSSTDTYWALAIFAPAAGSPLPLVISLQDGGEEGIFTMPAGGSWQVRFGPACPGADFPTALATLWGRPESPQCAPTPKPLPTLTIGKWTGRKPDTIFFSADGANVAVDLTWPVWDTTHAVGHAIRYEQDCVPNCVSGKLTPHQVTITLSGVEDGQFTVLTEETDDSQHATETFHAPYIAQGVCPTSDQSTCMFVGDRVGTP